MKIGTTYYRLLDSLLERTAALYRIRYSSSALHVERFDPAAASWTKGPNSFLRFVNDGEIGADEISKTEAERMIAAGDVPEIPVEATAIAT